ncbi:Hint domain-containing protein [Pseudosulfitobacter sp. SM2401]|jgi:hypothetical protein|uniref:Hint domain-containing protein n=1 Tax=Pseudosulfitobacter sp. SM2401 TaxID=3350098 RepID=UPI0036F3C286
MKPKTVGRVESGQDPQARAFSTHAGIVAGSIIFTSDGEIPVEYLAPGDRIVTRDAGMVELRNITSLRITAPAVAIKAGSLGHTRPEHNVILPAAQHVLVRDWRAQSMFGVPNAVVQAGQLIDGEFITDLGARNMNLFHLTFDKTHVVYADGLEISVPLVGVAQSVAA